MTDFEATGLAEGFIAAESEEQVIDAWQHLHDTGLAYKLQGWFGRTAQELLKRGIITMVTSLLLVSRANTKCVGTLHKTKYSHKNTCAAFR